ncbi:MAG: SpoIIE family protein phosphatase [Planctomycetes bacterium]|nr:SpoIIE family protein phosphatase [Planctomycetota bacterium]
MAKAREREREKESRPPPPPRVTGLTLVTTGLLAAAGAALFALVGALLAGSKEDTTASDAADSLGVGLAYALTAPDADWWTEGHGSRKEAFDIVRKELGQAMPEIDKGKRDQMQNEWVAQRDRNRARLAAIGRAGGLETGALRGLMIHWTAKNLLDQTAGARIRPEEFQSYRTIGDVSVGRLQATSAAGEGTFLARVYHRPYKRGNEQLGAAYVILAEAALSSEGGPSAWTFLTPLLVGLACAGFVVVASRASEGIKGVVRDLDTIGRGKLDHRVGVGGSGEVAYLRRSVDRMAKNLQLIQTTGSGDLDEAVAKELDLANQIHQGLLPADTPRLAGYELETLFKIGRAIGGDYHDYIELDENRMALALADCSESLRGVPAAMVMAMTRAYLKSAIDPSTGPAEWLKAVNRRLARDLKPGMAVTALVVVLDTSTHEAVAASAGHRPIVLWRAGKTATVNPNGIALGLDIGPVFDKTIEEKKFSLQKNDRVVLYTDGLIGAKDEKGEAYGEERFLEAVRRQGAMNSAAFVNFIAGGVDKFVGEGEQTDDITICTLKRVK